MMIHKDRMTAQIIFDITLQFCCTQENFYNY